VNRECMLYAATESDPSSPNWSVRSTHQEIFDRFTGHLGTDDIDFFQEWDRLIDLEADASSRSVALSWLTMSKQREQQKGETISSLVYDGPKPAGEGKAIMIFRRSSSGSSVLPTTLDSLSFSRGDQVVIGTDATSFGDTGQQKQHRNNRSNTIPKRFRHRMHIVRGTVERLRGDSILIAAGREDLERIRDMVQRYRKEFQNSSNPQLLFRVDKDKASIGVGTLRQNMLNFLTADSPSKMGETTSPDAALKQIRLPRLRDIVIRLKPPQVDCHPRDSFFKDPVFQIPGCDMVCLSEEFKKLNSDQQNAVEMVSSLELRNLSVRSTSIRLIDFSKVINAKDFAIIQGLPGTGKTQTLVFITRLLAARGKRVLVTSYTHSAVDNVVLKLIEKGVNSAPEALSPVVRIAKKTSCHKEVHSLLVSELAGRLECNILSQDSCLGNNGLSTCSSQTSTSSASSESLKQVMSNARIVCCTALSAPRSPLLLDEKFDVVIVDEAGQISQPAILGALMIAESFVLVGDHLQLPPLVTSEIAECGGTYPCILQHSFDCHLMTCLFCSRFRGFVIKPVDRKASHFSGPFDISVSHERRHMSYQQFCCLRRQSKVWNCRCGQSNPRTA
jgi:DNA replication ATP-dependent helicase Dna2